MNKKLFYAVLMAGAVFTACDSGTNEETAEVSEESVVEVDSAEIQLVKAVDSPEFADAMLEQTQPDAGANLQPGPVTFNYNVKNYQLSEMTPDAHSRMIANSEKGQHIHLILNNEPYEALYETTYQKDLEPGHYVELSFLSRSYHESIKNPDAYVLRQFTVGDAPSKEVDLNAPHLFYSRPKGTYTGPQTDSVMLDFYLVNTELSQEGYKVRATINGEEFMIYDWKPYYITGLPMGENTIKLELLDAQGKLVESPLNPVTRTITLEPGETQASVQ